MLGIAVNVQNAFSSDLWPIPDWQSSNSPEEVGLFSDKLQTFENWLDNKAGSKPYGTLIVRFGKIGYEHYGGGATGSDLWDIGSIRKSVASVLLGMAIEEGKLTLHDPVYPIWPDIYSITGKEKDKGISMWHLVTTSSGWKTTDLPGTDWRYCNSAFTAGGMVIGRGYNKPEDEIAPLVESRIKEKIGANNWKVYHHTGRITGAGCSDPGPKLAIDSDLRDLARYGYFWLKQGVWNDEQVVSKKFMTEGSSNQVGHLNAHYGYSWFVNENKALLPDAPEDAFFHPGNGSNSRRTQLFVCPSLDMVAVVGTRSDAYNITDGYKYAPVTVANELFAEMLKAVDRSAVENTKRHRVSIKERIVVTPNPFSASAVISPFLSPKIALDAKSKHILSLVEFLFFDVNGKLVQKMKIDSRRLKTGISWSPQNLPSGVYILKVQFDNRSIPKKLIYLQ